MDFRKEKTSLEHFKEQDMVVFLDQLGFQPAKIRGNDYWYSSPLRDEHIPSFKINRRLNKWFDHGIGKGGNLIDFGILYYGCTVSELIQKSGSDSTLYKPLNNQAVKTAEHQENKIQIIDVKPLASKSLFDYLSQRKIPAKIALAHCKEVTYKLGSKQYYAIGFKNNSGGYEIRSAFVKLSSSPKDVSFTDKSSSDIRVFEGFFDMLSYIAFHDFEDTEKQSLLVLNSLSFFEKARPVLEAHQHVKLYLDRDQAGIKQTLYALSISEKYKDQSILYKDHKDLNDWLVASDSSYRKTLNLKRGLNPNESLWDI